MMLSWCATKSKSIWKAPPPLGTTPVPRPRGVTRLSAVHKPSQSDPDVVGGCVSERRDRHALEVLRRREADPSLHRCDARGSHAQDANTEPEEHQRRLWVSGHLATDRELDPCSAGSLDRDSDELEQRGMQRVAIAFERGI